MQLYIYNYIYIYATIYIYIYNYIYITIWSRDHESPGYETIIQVFCPLEIRRQAKVASFHHPEN